MSEQIINSQASLNAFMTHLQSEFEKHKYLKIAVKTGKQRTLTQNAALHLYCQMLADAFNDAGMDMKTVLKDEVEIPWTMESTKNHLWKPIQKIVTGKESTTKPLTHEYGEIYEVLSRFLSEKKGVFVPWPSNDVMDRVA